MGKTRITSFGKGIRTRINPLQLRTLKNHLLYASIGDDEMSEIPEGLYYTKEHEWIKVDGDQVIIGITDHAQNALTDIV